jgi:outer membrane biosynthesis protein TonB
LFKTSDDESNWVRVPVVNYLRACPLPEAKTKLDELAKLDPETVKRANSFFPFAGTPAAAAVPAKEKPADATSDEAAPKPPAPVAADTDKEPVKPATAAKQPAESPKPDVKAEKAEADKQEEKPAPTTGASLPNDKQKSVAATTAALPPPFAKDAAPIPAPPASSLGVFAGLGAAAVLLSGAFWAILRGGQAA